MWTWGKNNYGQLGDSTTTNKNTPQQVGSEKTWVSISAGTYHTVALKSNGTLWTWGFNGFGQLGDGTTTSRSIPAKVGNDATWIGIHGATIAMVSLAMVAIYKAIVR